MLLNALYNLLKKCLVFVQHMQIFGVVSQVSLEKNLKCAVGNSLVSDNTVSVVDLILSREEGKESEIFLPCAVYGSFAMSANST